MRFKARTTIATAVALASTIAAAPDAHARVYTVYACGGPAGAAQNAFRAAADPLMNAYTICPASNIATGVATKVTSSGGTVAYLGGAYQIFDAPQGATLDSVDLSVAELRMDPEWTVGIVAYDDFSSGLFAFGCASGGPGCDLATPAFYGPINIPLYNRRSFRLETRCGNPRGCSAASSGKSPANRAIFSATGIAVHVGDAVPPALDVAGQLWLDGWHRRTERVFYSGFDNVGVRYNRVEIDGRLLRQDDYADQSWSPAIRCDFTRPAPCTNVGGFQDIDTDKLADGNHSVRVVAIDAADNPTARTHSIAVDNTAPGRVAASLDGATGWRRENGFDLRWQTPPGQFSPITRAHFRICRAGGGECVEGSQAGAGIERLSQVAAPGRGDYEVRVWLEDAAGNLDSEHASDPLHLRFDDRAPEGSFDPADDADPARIAATVVDRESAVASAEFELRRDGSSTWHELVADLQGSRLIAQLDDAELPDGLYRLRLRARDLAGNELLTGARGDGSEMTVRLPLRLGTRIEASVRTQAKVSRKCIKRKRGKHRRRPLCRKRVQQVAVAGDGDARLQGRLTTADGAPLADQLVSVRERLRSQSRELRSAGFRTDRLGRFTYRSGAGPSRSVQFEFKGTKLAKPATSRIDLAVAARSTARVRPHRVSNGRSVIVSGRLLGDFLPAGGKLVELQAHFRGRWRTFATPRADAKGNWRYRYRFGATSGVVRYALRARIPREDSYPYEAGASRAVHVVVRG